MSTEPNYFTSDEIKQAKVLLGLLKQNLKFLRDAGADIELVEIYTRLLKVLQSRGDDGILALIHKSDKKTRTKSRKLDDTLSNTAIREMDIKEVETLIHGQKLTRKYLEQIAAERFGLTKGALSAISNREQLISRIDTLIDNEKTHESIRRRASSES